MIRRSYSPELNPAEQIWRMLKKTICNKVFKTLDTLSEHPGSVIWETITNDTVKSITGYQLYLSAYQTIYDL